MIREHFHAAAFCAALLLLLAGAADVQAQALPGSADAGRIRPDPLLLAPKQPAARISIPEAQAEIDIPEETRNVTFLLKGIKLEGVTAFREEELADIYAPLLGKEIPLARIWEVSGRVTERYRSQQYFLSRAYVPAQEIEDGTVTLRVIEGSVGEVALDDPIAKRVIVKKLIADLIAQVPLKAEELESFLLRMNDLPGHSFHAVIEPLEGEEEGRTKLRLTPSTLPGKANISFDNYGSRYLGPYETVLTYQDNFYSLHQTAISLSASTPASEMKYAAVNHQVPLMPELKLGLSGSYVVAKPGALLAPNDIDSASKELGVMLSYQPTRQWLDNLTFSLRLDGKNTDSNVLGDNPLTRDRIRAVRFSTSWDTPDGWDGHNYLSGTVSKGLNILSASRKGDFYLSRAQADPEFLKGEFSFLRQQPVGERFQLVTQLSGQYASAPLYSAEEFGYGGQAFGRAYDPSEITGDHGIAASAELRYRGLQPWHEVNFMPYTFYDIGKVWNEDSGGGDFAASSVGTGVYLNHSSGLDSNLGIAWPLIRDVSTPLYGSERSPRFLFKLGLGF